MASNTNLHDAKKAKNDEFYTRYEDVEKEMVHYKDQLKGKWIYSPCDDYRWSNFVKYFKTNFTDLGLRHYTATCYDIGDGAWRYDYDGENETITKLDGNGDFRSDECTAIKNDCDIVITNPPFSLMRDFIKWLEMKDCIIVANKNTLLWKDVFPTYMNGVINFGYNMLKYFVLPDDAERYYDIVDGKKINDYQSSGRWITTFKVHKEEIDPILYPETEFEKYDNHDFINTDSILRIPDTVKPIGVPIGVLDHPIKGYKIIGKLNSNKNEYDFGQPIVNGKTIYTRVVIQKQVPG